MKYYFRKYFLNIPVINDVGISFGDLVNAKVWISNNIWYFSSFNCSSSTQDWEKKLYWSKVYFFSVLCSCKKPKTIYIYSIFKLRTSNFDIYHVAGWNANYKSILWIKWEIFSPDQELKVKMKLQTLLGPIFRYANFAILRKKISCASNSWR